MKPFLTVVTAFMALMGLSNGSAPVVALANALFGFGFAVADGLGIRRGKVTPLSFAAMASGLAGLANYFMIVQTVVEDGDSVGYGMPQWYLHAAFLNYVGGVFVQAGGWICGLVRAGKGRGILPAVWFVPGKAISVPWTMLGVGVLGLVSEKGGLIPEMGRLSAILVGLPITAIFAAARWGYGRNQPVVIWCTFAFAAIVSCNALLYAYLRGMVLIPWLAFAMGGVLGKPRRSTLAGGPFLLVYGVAAIFLAYFGIMGSVRSERLYGAQRISRYMEVREGERQSGSSGEMQSPMSRQATVSKQSRIFDLVADRGFYRGESMEYYAYVFIPRFLWPGKPIIQKGGWFADQLGLADDMGENRFSNAINMTVPGELYLNFGWVGVAVGCIIMGFVLLMIWRTTFFWESDSNITGSLLAFQLIYRGICDLGPDMQSLVGYINTYLALWALSAILRALLPRRAAGGMSRVHRAGPPVRSQTPPEHHVIAGETTQ